MLERSKFAGKTIRGIILANPRKDGGYGYRSLQIVLDAPMKKGGGTMRNFYICASVIIILGLSACGGGGGNTVADSQNLADAASRSPKAIATHITFPQLAGQHYRVSGPLAIDDARQMPIYHNGENLIVGVDQGAAVGELPIVGKRGEIAVRHGQLRDRAGRQIVSNFLDEAIGAPVVTQRYESAPIVRVIGPSNERERERVIAAVQLVNAALPERSKMTVGTELPEFSLRNTVNNRGRFFVSGRELDGTIHVEFLPCSAYYGCSRSGATAWNERDNGEVKSTYIQMSHGTPAYQDNRMATILIAHELLHGLGLKHVSTDYDTIMHTGDIFAVSQGTPQPLSLLYPVDREALRVLYGSGLEIGDSPDDFGPWDDASWHVVGTAPHFAFGVAVANGYTEPWAYGLRPLTMLTDNQSLSGSATWRGLLLGLTPLAEAVAGDAEIGVNLASMQGTAEFTALETWPARSAPGEAGSGIRWLDGDLAYTILVQGNSFRRTGGDAGTLTGIFVGRSHEGVGGTLERSDLTAAFGASR